MIKKKICMLGGFAVGKTSLIQRFVNSIFSDKYHTTIGVKIDQKIVNIDNRDVNLILWDIHGEDEFQKIKSSYLMGTSGYFLVMDGTRKNSLKIAKELQEKIEKMVGKVPFIGIINKTDLTDLWEFEECDEEDLKAQNWLILKTSAKTGFGVEKAFEQLARMILRDK